MGESQMVGDGLAISLYTERYIMDEQDSSPHLANEWRQQNPSIQPQLRSTDLTSRQLQGQLLRLSVERLNRHDWNGLRELTRVDAHSFSQTVT